MCNNNQNNDKCFIKNYKEVGINGGNFLGLYGTEIETTADDYHVDTPDVYLSLAEQATIASDITEFKLNNEEVKLTYNINDAHSDKSEVKLTDDGIELKYNTNGYAPDVKVDVAGVHIHGSNNVELQITDDNGIDGYGDYINLRAGKAHVNLSDNETEIYSIGDIYINGQDTLIASAGQDAEIHLQANGDIQMGGNNTFITASDKLELNPFVEIKLKAPNINFESDDINTKTVPHDFTTNEIKLTSYNYAQVERNLYVGLSDEQYGGAIVFGDFEPNTTPKEEYDDYNNYELYYQTDIFTNFIKNYLKIHGIITL